MKTALLRLFFGLLGLAGWPALGRTAPVPAAVRRAIDSLQAVRRRPGQPDTVRSQAAGVLARRWVALQPDSALRYARRGVRLAGQSAQPAARAAAYTALGNMLYMGDDMKATQQAFEQELRLARATGRPLLLANAYLGLGQVALVLHDMPDAWRYLEQAQAAYGLPARPPPPAKACYGLILTWPSSTSPSLNATGYSAARSRWPGPGRWC